VEPSKSVEGLHRRFHIKEILKEGSDGQDLWREFVKIPSTIRFRQELHVGVKP
jgi:hypothetical protein